MGGTKGYRSYRGRGSKGKAALAAVLVLVIVAALGFLWVQEYIVYDADGGAHLELPWQTGRRLPPRRKTPKRMWRSLSRSRRDPQSWRPFPWWGHP